MEQLCEVCDNAPVEIDGCAGWSCRDCYLKKLAILNSEDGNFDLNNIVNNKKAVCEEVKRV